MRRPRHANKCRRGAVTTSTRFGILLRLCHPRIPPRAGGSYAMLAPIRAGFVAALAILASFSLNPISAVAADKAFQRDDLAQAAIKLEPQIKAEAGPPGQP